VRLALLLVASYSGAIAIVGVTGLAAFARDRRGVRYRTMARDTALALAALSASAAALHLIYEVPYL
jgi:hypothetical protein